MLCTQNIIIDKVRHTVAEDRIGIFINCFLCVYKFQKHVLWTKTLYRVQKFVTLLQGQTSAILLDCTIGVYEFKNMFRKQKTIIVDKIRPIVAEVRISIFINCFFCVLLVPQICFVDKKYCTVCKNSLLFCVRQCTTKDEVCKKTIQSCNKDVSVMQLLIPFSRHPQRKTAILTFAPVSALLTGSVCANLWQVQPCATSSQ